MDAEKSRKYWRGTMWGGVLLSAFLGASIPVTKFADEKIAAKPKTPDTEFALRAHDVVRGVVAPVGLAIVMPITLVAFQNSRRRNLQP